MLRNLVLVSLMALVSTPAAHALTPPHPALPPNAQVIDANGMSAMPGFIDAHRHINTGPEEKAQMQRQLEAGYTTILSGGGPGDGNLTLREHIENGTINGPRIIPSERLRLDGLTPEAGREAVRKMKAMGIDYTGEISLTPVPGPSAQELETLRAVLDEGKKVGVNVQVHAVSSPAMNAAVEMGIPLLVHLPNKDWVSKADAEKLAAAGTKILMTIGFGAPVFGPMILTMSCMENTTFMDFSSCSRPASAS